MRGLRLLKVVDRHADPPVRVESPRVPGCQAGRVELDAFGTGSESDIGPGVDEETGRRVGGETDSQLVVLQA